MLSFHDLYVIAKGEADGWVLKQETRLDDICGVFTVRPQADGRVALLTCYNRYVTAPRTGLTRQDWLLRQERNLSDCGKFRYDISKSGEIAFITCAGNFFTAGNDTWPGLEWLLVAETPVQLAWELFILQPP